MLVEMTCLVGGVPVGYLLRSDARVVKATQQSLIWSVRVLLFLLGLALGSDDALMAGLGTIGLRGAWISICCLAGTLVGARLIQPFLKTDEDGAAPAAACGPSGARSPEARSDAGPAADAAPKERRP